MPDRASSVSPPGSSGLTVLPDGRLSALGAAYAAVGARRRAKLMIGMAALMVAVAISAHVAEIDPATVWNKIGGLTSYVDRIATLESGARVWTDPAEWFWGLKRWSRLLAETLLMGYIGTISGALAGFGACFFASRTTCRSAWLRFAARRLLEFCRTVPTIVFALVFVVAFGVGPLAGVLALAIHTAGTLGKLFAEVVENADPKPGEGVRASGGTLVETIRFGVLPQVMASFASYALLRFEINVREATVMGFVGGGGIGEELLVAIQRFYYSDVSAILVMIVVTVFAIDIATERLRNRLFPGETR